jgi:type II secretory pathway component PulF
MYGLPPLFLWIVNGCGEDLARGFAQASELYQRRANHRIELMLYAALPVAVVILGSLILFEATPAFQALIHLMDAIGDTGA